MADFSYQEEILIDESYFSSLCSDINNATQTINLETYIFTDDELGKQISNVLIQAAQRGVKVRVMIDGVGLLHGGENLLIEMISKGVQGKVYHPLPWYARRWYHEDSLSKNIFSKILYLFTKINKRDHRKTCVIDNKIVYVGSANITETYLPAIPRKYDLRDTNIKITHINPVELNYAFEKAWGLISIRNLVKKIFTRMDPDPIFRLNYSWRRRRSLYKSLIKKIKYCKNRIWVTNTYFIPDEMLLRQLRKAARRGVDVKILLPSKHELQFLKLVSKTFYASLLKEGVCLYEYLPRVLHAKSLILDDWYCVGSSNLNSRSFIHDLEVDVNVRTESAQAFLEKQFSIDIENAKQIDLDEINKIPYVSRLIAKLLSLIRYWL